MDQATPTVVTVKKEFEWAGHPQAVGSAVEIYVGSNMSEDRYKELLDAGFITVGRDQDFMNEVASKKSAENSENKGSD